MSYYYNYYIGYRKDGKIYPWGPYDANGSLHPVVCNSRSFASDLYENFEMVDEKCISDELRKAFAYTDWEGNERIEVKYLPAKELPHGSYVRSGYYLIDDVARYEESDSLFFDGFFDRLSPQVYAAKLENQLKFGENKPKVDEDGDMYTEHNASDYMFYAYPDYQSREYEAWIIDTMVEALTSYKLQDVEYVILETEG